jgi:hypothetical protein
MAKRNECVETILLLTDQKVTFLDSFKMFSLPVYVGPGQRASCSDFVWAVQLGVSNSCGGNRFCIFFLCRAAINFGVINYYTNFVGSSNASVNMETVDTQKHNSKCHTVRR